MEDYQELWDHMNEFNEDDVKKIFNSLTKEQKRKFTFEFLTSCIFRDLEDDDGRLELLNCAIDPEFNTIITFEGKKYQINFKELN
jgi:hypothetical protein